MKKIIMLLLGLVSIITCSGCGHMSTKKDVQKYLKEQYPGEKFTISFYKKIKLSGDIGGCDDAEGNTWIVKSEDTNISFLVQDEYSFNSFTCEYSLDNNYFDIYLTNVIEKINNPKIKIDDVTNPVEKGYGFLPIITSIDLNLSDFNSKEELADFIIDVRSKLLTDSRIKEKLLDKYSLFSFQIYYDDENYWSISFSKSDNADYILEEFTQKETEAKAKEDSMNNKTINVTINNQTYEATIESNKTARSFIELLPKTFTMKEINGNEKYIYMDNSLPSNPAKPDHIQSGDIMLFGDNCLVIFYKSFNTNYRYTKIGHIDSLPDLGSGSITATFKNKDQ